MSFNLHGLIRYVPVDRKSAVSLLIAIMLDVVLRFKNR